MNIKQYLDSTYLKTAAQAKKKKKENTEVVKNCIQEAIDNDFKLIMIRPDKVVLEKKMIQASNSKVTIGTVIDFPLGNGTLEDKLTEAKQAIENGVDDLDYVVDYEAFKRGEIDIVKEQVLQGTKLGLAHNKIVKWIIEVAALDNKRATIDMQKAAERAVRKIPKLIPATHADKPVKIKYSIPVGFRMK